MKWQTKVGDDVALDVMQSMASVNYYVPQIQGKYRESIAPESTVNPLTAI
jgi:hypothetical protein